jgi:hypothetical protein
MKSRLPLLLSATALLVSGLGSTSLDQAAGSAVATVVPRAKSTDLAARQVDLQYQLIIEYKRAPTGENEARTYKVPANGCPSGKSVLSGGYAFTQADADHLSVFQSRPQSKPSAWWMRIRNVTGQATGTITLYAMCAKRGVLMAKHARPADC